ncbi:MULTISPECIES: hypothetical protein [Trichocoleus]|uniref:Uncharacterized protein n=1 Tax=Trichocoleus desertorum GB2-A4 TaxID=2933944 RepID=A0ABV0J246_9CYAN|nr:MULTISPECIES: hypothetical protein [unclassified Trichocoleus]MBD1860455.1 hypothetical protein [Trichocoleus sp. FACHB-46]MBD2119811.1 hypothetical protein [Trichocoleus sp. FACHB-262]
MPHCNPILAVSEQKKCGLILCKAYHADFAGPGAAVGSPVEQGYNVVIAIGSPELVPVETFEERQKAYGRRIQWMRWLERITNYSDPALRVEKLLAGFEAFFSRQVVLELPDEVLALLVGVLPQTVNAVRSQQYGFWYTHQKKQASSWQQLSQPVLVPRSQREPAGSTTDYCFFDATSSYLSVYNFNQSIHQLPCSA